MAYDPKKFELAWDKVLKHFVKLYARLLDSGATREQIIRELVDIDIQDLVMVKFNLNGEMDDVMKAYFQELRGIESFAEVDENVLKSLLKADSLVYKTKIIESSEVLRKEMIHAVVGGLNEKAFAEALTKVGLQPYQAASLVDDSLKKFSRNVISEMANNAPDDYLYIWTGPVDDRTSDECLQLISAGPMTHAEFETVFPGAFVNGTHFGCRHEPQRFLSADQFKGKQAESFLNAN